MTYVNTKEAVRQLGVHPNTLRNWANAGKIKYIRTPGNQRLYDIDNFLNKQAEEVQVCYCRVSSHKQKEGLERQIQFIHEQFPKAEIIKDIGSGINFKRKGMQSILGRVMQGDKLLLVVAHKDRLCRFGFELFEHLIQINGGRILVLDESDTHSPETELTKDLLTILHVFSCRMHGLRKYKTQIKKDKDLSRP